ncbi:MAG: hypothetical protein N4A74_25965 [Carboxylicivirga sp.]|jgi:hypothetical protein|nr:hypothetical protein [Carboxylicivirga sp.]
MGFHLFEIATESHSSLCFNDKGKVTISSKIKKIALFDILPGAISITLILFGNLLTCNSNLISYLLTTYSIFSALLFSLIIVIVEKAKKQKETLKIEGQEDKEYLERYLRFSKFLITRISFTILIAFTLIITLIATQLTLNPFDLYLLKGLKDPILSFLTYYLSVQFFFMVLLIISEMYSLFLEELQKR